MLIAIGEKITESLSPIIYEITFLAAVHAGPAHATPDHCLTFNLCGNFLRPLVWSLFRCALGSALSFSVISFHPLLGWLGLVAAVVFLNRYHEPTGDD